MSKELQEALESYRTRRKIAHGEWVDANDKCFDRDSMAELCETLADAHLAEHPADDDEIADSVWLRSIGAVRPQAVAAETVYVLGEWKPYETGTTGQYPIELTWDSRRGAVDAKRAFIVRVFGFIVFMRPTRGVVRRLCRALWVETKEQTR